MTRHLLFVSTRFLFPVDSGGKIRTTQILKGMKGGNYRITLVSPATQSLIERHRSELGEVCDDFRWWPQPERGRAFHYGRLRHLLHELPIPVRTDMQEAGRDLVANLLATRPDAAVFDFTHAAVLAPPVPACPTVLFTHNVEAEIFARHLKHAGNPLARLVWSNQYRKMQRFEARALREFDVVVAVAERDAAAFTETYGISEPVVIPTGVDLDFFSYGAPDREREVVFCGSMDWLANQDAVGYLMDEVWPHVLSRVPDARMTVVGRSPPARLVSQAEKRDINWRFTGFVDDVRDYVRGAVSVLPLRVGGGTRLKVYEAMALGSPIVSTPIGVEGLNVIPGEHYVEADSAEALGRGVARLLGNPAERLAISRNARQHVERYCSYQLAARTFEEACDEAILRHGNRSVD